MSISSGRLALLGRAGRSKLSALARDRLPVPISPLERRLVRGTMREDRLAFSEPLHPVGTTEAVDRCQPAARQLSASLIIRGSTKPISAPARRTSPLASSRPETGGEVLPVTVFRRTLQAVALALPSLGRERRTRDAAARRMGRWLALSATSGG
jgi:hypothetical protein